MSQKASTPSLVVMSPIFWATFFTCLICLVYAVGLLASPCATTNIAPNGSQTQGCQSAWSKFQGLGLDAKGNTIAGFSGLIILVWVIAGTVLQRKELAQGLAEFRRLADAAEDERKQREMRQASALIEVKFRAILRKLSAYGRTVVWEVETESGPQLISLVDEVSKSDEDIVDRFWAAYQKLKETNRVLYTNVQRNTLNTKSSERWLITDILRDCEELGRVFGDQSGDQITRFNDSRFWDFFEDMVYLETMSVWIE